MEEDIRGSKGGGELSFDFEEDDSNVLSTQGDINSNVVFSTISKDIMSTSNSHYFEGPIARPTKPIGLVSRRNYRQTVCRHWLRGLCMKGENCGFLHQLDRTRMPICRFFSRYGECHEVDCVYKHAHEDIKECHMYKMGFCPNGPECRYRHMKLPAPFPPLQESLQKIQMWTIASRTRQYGRYTSEQQAC